MNKMLISVDALDADSTHNMHVCFKNVCFILKYKGTQAY